MYLQIRLPEEDTHVHRYLWRNLDQSKSPTTYALQRVTFGDKPSPDMASFVMMKMAKENQENNRNAATVLSRDRYMDDLIHSCPTPKKAIDTIRELDRVLKTGSFKIKEWLSSSKDVLKALTQESVMESHQDTRSVKSDSDSPVDLDGEKGVKTLGVGWDPQADVLSFAVKETKILKYTKRSILSKISRLYDPLGLASAVTIKAKIAVQNIWKSKEYDWDDPLPDDMACCGKSSSKKFSVSKASRFLGAYNLRMCQVCLSYTCLLMQADMPMEQ